MNTKSKILAWLLLATSLFTFSSCEKDLYEQNIQNSSRNISVNDVSLSKTDKNISSKIRQKISLLKESMNKSNSQDRFEYNNSLGIYIDAENGKLVNNNGQLYYTFPMFSKSEENIENIVFKPISNGEIETYLVKYNIKPEEFVELTNSQIHNLNQTVQKVLYEDDHVIIEQVCADLYIIETIYNSWELNEGNGNPSSSTTNEVFVTSFCSYNYTYLNTNGGGGSPPAGSNTNPDNGQVLGGVNNNGISTTPIPLSPEQIAIKDFVRGLNEDQQNWYTNQPSDIQILINEMLLHSFSVSTNQSFTIDCINSAMNGEDVDFNNNVIFGINKPCQKEIVKKILATSSPFTNLIKQTFNSSDKVNIKFSNGDIPSGDPAYTNPYISGTPENYSISIVLDNNYLDHATDLSIVAVTLHELVHAYLMSLYYNGQLVATNSDYNTLLNAFIGFYNNQVQDTFDTLDNEIHNAMNSFMSQMGNSIYNYALANNIEGVSPDFCVNLAWSTMYGTSLFQDVLTNQQQIEYGNTGAIEQDNLSGAKGTPCNN